MVGKITTKMTTEQKSAESDNSIITTIWSPSKILMSEKTGQSVDSITDEKYVAWCIENRPPLTEAQRMALIRQSLKRTEEIAKEKENVQRKKCDQRCTRCERWIDDPLLGASCQPRGPKCGCPADRSCERCKVHGCHVWE